MLHASPVRSIIFSVLVVVIIGVLSRVLVVLYKHAPRTNSSPCADKLEYPITPLERLDIPYLEDVTTRTMTTASQYCDVLLSDRPFAQKRLLFCNHDATTLEASPVRLACHNTFLQQLYESYFVKYILEDIGTSYAITLVHGKIFAEFNQDVIKGLYAEWVDADPPLFPVNQKNRNWDQYRKHDILQNLTGLRHDPTKVLLSGGLLKKLIKAIDAPFAERRDHVFNDILKRVRGYRTNSQKVRSVVSTNEIGILNFNFEPLEFARTWYNRAAWNHPGRVQCGTLPLQGLYEHSAYNLGIPIECGVSGSTNFWIWTALYSRVDLTLEETRLLVLSAFVVLCADGGHCLMEVLSSCVLSSIYWRHYERYSKDTYLLPYIKNSSFAHHLYDICKDINPVGNGELLCIDWDEVADEVYNSKCDDKCSDTSCPTEPDCVFPSFNDKAKPVDNVLQRQRLEAFFATENGRHLKPFGAYTTFIDQLSSDVRQINDHALRRVMVFANEYFAG